MFEKNGRKFKAELVNYGADAAGYMGCMVCGIYLDYTKESTAAAELPGGLKLNEAAESIMAGRYNDVYNKANRFMNYNGVMLYASGRMLDYDGEIEISACAVMGIVNGFEDGSFRPDYAITREQAAAMLARCAKKLGLSDKPGIFIFEDNESISGWARGHVRYVRANEIMNGDDNNCFMPHVCYTVEQAILTFYRMYIKCV